MVTVKELRAEASRQKIKGRSKMNKAQLMRALGITPSNGSTSKTKKKASSSKTKKKASASKTSKKVTFSNTAATRKEASRILALYGSMAQSDAMLDQFQTELLDKLPCLKVSDVLSVRTGKKSMWVIAPQDYSGVSKLDKEAFMFEDMSRPLGYFYAYPPGSKCVVSGSGADPWYVFNKKAYELIAKFDRSHA